MSFFKFREPDEPLQSFFLKVTHEQIMQPVNTFNYKVITVPASMYQYLKSYLYTYEDLLLPGSLKIISCSPQLCSSFCFAPHIQHYTHTSTHPEMLYTTHSFHIPTLYLISEINLISIRTLCVCVWTPSLVTSLIQVCNNMHWKTTFKKLPETMSSLLLDDTYCTINIL